MAVIIKKLQNVNSMDRKSAYTWGGCILVFFLIASTLLTLLGGEEESADNMASLKTKGYDLAAMPFASDAAEEELLNGPYSDIAANPINSTLFSQEDKEARQEEDAEFGEPGPADEEYANADYEAELAARRAESLRAGSYERPSTFIGKMSSGGGMAGGGGSGGFSSGSAWAPGNSAASGSSKGSGASNTAAGMMAALSRTTAGRAALSANAAAKKGDALEALESMTNVLEGGEDEVLPDLEKAAEAALPAPPEAAAPPDVSKDELEKAAEKAADKKDKENNLAGNCQGKDSMSFECMFQSIVVPALIGWGGKALKLPDAVTTGIVTAYTRAVSSMNSSKEASSNKD